MDGPFLFEVIDHQGCVEYMEPKNPRELKDVALELLSKYKKELPDPSAPFQKREKQNYNVYFKIRLLSKELSEALSLIEASEKELYRTIGIRKIRNIDPDEKGLVIQALKDIHYDDLNMDMRYRQLRVHPTEVSKVIQGYNIPEDLRARLNAKKCGIIIQEFLYDLSIDFKRGKRTTNYDRGKGVGRAYFHIRDIDSFKDCLLHTQ